MARSKKLIESMEFDNYAYAKDVLEESKKKLERIKIGLLIAAVASLCTILAFVIPGDVSLGLFISLAVIGAIAAYIIGGGFSIALRAAKKLAFFGWFILPFPVDIATGLVTMIISVFAFFLFPLLFVFLNYRQIKRNRDDAETFLQYCKKPSDMA